MTYHITFHYTRRRGQRKDRYPEERETLQVEASDRQQAIYAAFNERESRAFGRRCEITAVSI